MRSNKNETCIVVCQMSGSLAGDVRKRFRSPQHPAARVADGRALYVDVSQQSQRRRYFREYRRKQRAQGKAAAAAKATD